MSKEYEKQAQAFLTKTGTTLEIKFVGNDFYFPGDEETRDIYRFTLKRGNKKYSAKFGQSIANSGEKVVEIARFITRTEKRKEPTAYDILACLNVDYSETIDDFASEFGYNNENTKPSELIRTWQAVQEQNKGLKSLYSEKELEKLAEIN